MEGCQARDLPDWEAWEAGGIWKVSSKRQSGWEAWEAGDLTDMERYQAKGLSGEET